MVQYKYFSVLYSPIKNHNCLLLSFSDRTLAASGAFWLKPTIYSADLTSLGSNKIVVRGFSDDFCYSTTYPGHIVMLWIFWECFVYLALVVVAAVTIDWQLAQLWLGHKNGGDKTLWRHMEPMNSKDPWHQRWESYFTDIRYFQKMPSQSENKDKTWYFPST